MGNCKKGREWYNGRCDKARNRKDKDGGGVMIMTEKNIRVEKVETSENMAEVIKVGVRNAQGIVRGYMGVYVPPKQVHGEILSTTTC